MNGLVRLLLAVVAMSAYPLAHAAAITFSASGANPAGIQATVDAFRTSLGTLNSNVPGSFGTGRREINWDGVPDALSAPNNLPALSEQENMPAGGGRNQPGVAAHRRQRIGRRIGGGRPVGAVGRREIGPEITVRAARS